MFLMNICSSASLQLFYKSEFMKRISCDRMRMSMEQHFNNVQCTWIERKTGSTFTHFHTKCCLTIPIDTRPVILTNFLRFHFAHMFWHVFSLISFINCLAIVLPNVVVFDLFFLILRFIFSVFHFH